MKKPIIISTALLAVLALAGCGDTKNEEKSIATAPVQETSAQQEATLTEDYSNIDAIVKKELAILPSVAKEVEKANTLSLAEIEAQPLTEAFITDKGLFRLAVQNQLTGAELESDAKKVVETRNQASLQALQNAESLYATTITQQEVSQYIAKTITPNATSEAQQYAQALGITVEQLNTSFDRDFYIMDTLWEKVTPVIMAKYPEQDGEDADSYLQRIQKELYGTTIE